MKGWMYILECSDGSFYTGSTIDLLKRFDEHQAGLVPITLVKGYPLG